MKKIALLLIIVVFLVCAVLGFSLANRVNGDLAVSPETQRYDGKAEQHNMILVQVDQLGSEQPRLESVWFVSLYFLEANPPIVTFAQIFPPRTPTAASQTLENAFRLDRNGEPATGFWNILRANKLSWEGYMLVDQQALEIALGWLHNGGSWGTALTQKEESTQAVQQTCQALVGLADRSMEPFHWSGFAPAHFRSNIKMENSLSYWDRLITTEQPVRCEVILAP